MDAKFKKQFQENARIYKKSLDSIIEKVCF